MSTKIKIKLARRAVPKCQFECLKGCHECCTSVNFTNEEKELIDKELINNGYSEPPNGKGKDYCEYLTKDARCSVYNERPFLCRAFGNYKMPFLVCNHFTSDIVRGNRAKDNFGKEEMDYMKEIFKQGSPMNEGGAIFRSTLEPEDEAISKGPKGIVPYAGLVLNLFLAKDISEEKMTKILTRLEGAMKLANDSLESYYAIKIVNTN